LEPFQQDLRGPRPPEPCSSCTILARGASLSSSHNAIEAPQNADAILSRQSTIDDLLNYILVLDWPLFI
ncbi:hypothetical protein, partial [Acinetobacter baumannii]|uniref:hypothetical protein n=1 Tax=Acinetobacter baumannii TaxID=470 RepID=UPI001C0838EE